AVVVARILDVDPQERFVDQRQRAVRYCLLEYSAGSARIEQLEAFGDDRCPECANREHDRVLHVGKETLGVDQAVSVSGIRSGALQLCDAFLKGRQPEQGLLCVGRLEESVVERSSAERLYEIDGVGDADQIARRGVRRGGVGRKLAATNNRDSGLRVKR